MTSLALLIAGYRAGLADYEANHPRGEVLVRSARLFLREVAP